MSNDRCQTPGCRRTGTPSVGAAGEQILCTIHKPLADYTPALLGSWLRIAQAIATRRGLYDALGKGESRRYRVRSDDGSAPLVVEFENYGARSLSDGKPVLGVRLMKRPFGRVRATFHSNGDGSVAPTPMLDPRLSRLKKLDQWPAEDVDLAELEP